MARAIASEKKPQFVSAALALLCIDAPNTRMAVRVRDVTKLENFLLASWSEETATIRPVAAGLTPNQRIRVDDVLCSEEVRRLALGATSRDRYWAHEACLSLVDTAGQFVMANSRITNGDGKVLSDMKVDLATPESFRLTFYFT
ncbi:hypothetical protein GNI_090520 [Gregarina niphandrodes]|uniref:Uncharacterized protein n=1 Tax=Gregarina niphandrodes TaxID=110365 RepID=A0A023B5P4_GRENI|nr:hypothetical protein GNI_090520 [Gregarina niphandrodes]EZG60422.1 hypothetical protein GNI_090520 [Gregarina niphandrodes]|eukprot:XP_011130830.1 hypothetical protein GNI_090520 [Gregarina niphandrodes]